ncbi:hypothetical protein CNR22_00710 [Sphingobacteriaceae bacterium]|nr:hypothetical protein CNR22_00710 [Sphingobacteriaceae bacterium]
MELKEKSELLLLLAQCYESCTTLVGSAESDMVTKKETRSISLCKDAAQMSHTTSAFLLRNSFNSKRALKFCSELLHRAADELEMHPNDPKIMECRDVCRATAEACEYAS